MLKMANHLSREQCRHVFGKFVEWGFAEESNEDGKLSWKLKIDKEEEQVSFADLGLIMEEVSIVLAEYLFSGRLPDKPPTPANPIEDIFLWERAFRMLTDVFKPGFSEYWRLAVNTHYQFHSRVELGKLINKYREKFEGELWLDQNIRL